MKRQKGVSLVALIITVVVLIILLAIAVGSSFEETIDDAGFTRAVSEMTEVYDAVVQRSMENKLDEEMYQYAGTKLTDDSPKVVGGISYGEGYYYIEDDAHKEALNLTRVEGKYIVNYDTGEVISSTRILYEDKSYHALSDLAEAVQPGSTVTAEGEYNTEKGVNAPIISEGMIPVKMQGGKWIATSDDDEEWYDYANGVWATIMLTDELEVEGINNATIRSMTQEEKLSTLKGLEVIVEGSTFVWIPRHTYKVENGEVKVMYSNLTEDYTGNGYIKNPAFYFGEYQGAESDVGDVNSGYVSGGKELTGIWVSKYEAGYTN